jgi:ribosomal protein L34E
LLGSVCSIITNLDEGSNTFYRQMDELNRFMKEKAITAELRVKLRDYFRFRRNSRALVEWSGVMHLMSDALRLDVAEEVFGGWIRAMPIFRDCPKRLPAMLSAHLSSLVLSPHENLMANPVRRDSLFIVEKGLIAHRGKIQETGALLGMERIYKAQSELLESSPPAVTLCHAVVLCLRRDALLGVVAEFPETQKQMRNIVCRLIMRETVVAYARAIVQSVRVSSSSMTEAGGSGGTKKAPPGGSVQVIRFMLGEHLDDSLSDMAEKHRLHLMARERPDEFDRMERAVLYVQRVYRGHVTRRALRAVLLTAEGSERGVTPGTKAMFQVLFNLRLHKHAEEFREIGLERRHLAATSALELCQVTSLPFADAADVILLARQLENENPMVSDRKSDRKSSRRGRPADAVSDDFRPAVPAATASKNAHPKKRDNVQITSESSRFSKHQSSKEVFAARAFAKPEDRLGLTVLLAAAKFREGGARRRARRG